MPKIRPYRAHDDHGGFEIGDTVQVVSVRRRAKILKWYTDIIGGVILDRKIADFRIWNVKDLKLIRRGKREAK